MLWRVGILTMFLAWMLLAAPVAAAGVQRQIDSQGVIRISNIAPTQPGQSQQDSPGIATAAADPGSKPASRPPMAAAEKPNPAIELPAAATPQNAPR